MGSEAAQPQMTSTTEYLTVAQVALLLGVAKSFVYRRTSPHHPDPIPCYRFGGHLRFLGSEIEEWAAGHRKSVEGPATAVPSGVVALNKSRGSRVRLRVREPRS
jgi:excisionase family DNA binding protein